MRKMELTIYPVFLLVINNFLSYLIMRQISLLFIGLVVSLVFFSSCDKDKYANSPFSGSWYIKTQVIENGIDMTQSRWEIWDALSYDFKPDGTLIVSGGPEPIENLECQYFIVGDSTLHVIRPWRGNTMEDHYSIISITPDTIWLRNNASYIIYPDSTSQVSSGGIEFLERR